MPLFEHGAVRVEIDDHGFLVQPDAWTESVAAALAEADGIGALTAEHWKVIRYLREYQARHGAAPMIRRLCVDTGFALQHIYELFPAGPARGACRVAGLPRPTGCV